MSLDPKATWMFRRGGRTICARAIAFRELIGRTVVILRDPEEALWIGEWSTTGGKITAGPVTLAEALRAAEGVVFGRVNHGSVAALVNELALAAVLFNVAVEQPGVLDPARYPLVPDAPEVRAC